MGHLGCLASDFADGPSFLFEPSTSALELDGPLSMLHFIDDCLAAHVNTGPDGTHLAPVARILGRAALYA
jgi:hypothetical protein